MQINVTSGQIEKLKNFFDTGEEVEIRCTPGYKLPILSATAMCNVNKTFTPSSVNVRCERKGEVLPVEVKSRLSNHALLLGSSSNSRKCG